MDKKPLIDVKLHCQLKQLLLVTVGGTGLSVLGKAVFTLEDGQRFGTN